MRTAKQWLSEELGIEMPNGVVDGTWFGDRGLPMVVRCTCCNTTMVLPSAFLNDEGEIFCSSCAE